MRVKSIAFIIGLCLAGSGCSVIRYSNRGIAVTTGRVINQFRSRLQEREAADQAWRQLRKSCPDHTFSQGYADGFRRGFTEYLDAGGNCTAPGLPPACYRTAHYETPAGLKEVEDWYAGYRHGVAAATESGLRRSKIVPPSAEIENSMAAPLGTRLPESPDDPYAPPDLPTPRPLPPPVRTPTVTTGQPGVK